MIGCTWIGRNLRSKLALVSKPFYTTTIQATNIFMCIKFEDPQCPGGKPIIVVPVKYNRGIVAHSCASQQLFQVLLAEWSAYHLVLKLFLPVETNCATNMPLVIGSSIDVNFDQANLRIVQVSLDPICIHQDFWLNIVFVFRHDHSFCKVLNWRIPIHSKRSYLIENSTFRKKQWHV